MSELVSSGKPNSIHDGEERYNWYIYFVHETDNFPSSKDAVVDAQSINEGKPGEQLHRGQGQGEERVIQRDHEDEDEEFVYPGETSADSSAPQIVIPRQLHPSPAQLESLYAAASSGDLTLLKRLFKSALETGDVQPFSLANDASSRTGFTALHAAASRGYLHIVKWREFSPFCKFI